jgi:hypothetical protein
MVFLSVDIVFIFLYVVHGLRLDFPITQQIARNQQFSLAEKGGYAEIFEYLKLLGSVAGMGRLAWAKRRLLYGIGTLLFAFLLFANVSALHNEIGRAMADAYTFGALAPALEEGAVQLAFWTVVGAGVALAGGFAYWREDAAIRALARAVALGLAGLGFFGVVLDALPVIVGAEATSPFLKGALTLVEDGGELIMLSWIAAVVLAAAFQDRA